MVNCFMTIVHRHRINELNRSNLWVCIFPFLLFYSSENNCELSRNLFVQDPMESNALEGVLADMEIASGVVSLCE